MPLFRLSPCLNAKRIEIIKKLLLRGKMTLGLNAKRIEMLVQQAVSSAITGSLNAKRIEIRSWGMREDPSPLWWVSMQRGLKYKILPCFAIPHSIVSMQRGLKSVDPLDSVRENGRSQCKEDWNSGTRTPRGSGSGTVSMQRGLKSTTYKLPLASLTVSQCKEDWN